MFYVYVVFNRKHRKFYIGQTADLKERLILHNTKTFKGSYTASFDGEWELIYSESAITREDAIIREKQLKSYRGREFVKKYIPR
jgi:putative endonuclease